jgi:nucleoside-diphosphate-sugar epimerase
MTFLVVGGTGATGQLLVGELLSRGHRVRAIVRSVERLPESIRNHKNLSIIAAPVLELSDEELAKYVQDCNGLASCLGHNLSFKGIYGNPRYLVTEAVLRLCNAVKANQQTKPTKFVLMNTAGNRNQDLKENISFSEKWAAVRPDDLTHEEETTEYKVYSSPIRSAIFNPGKTSRINVGHFMAELLTNEKTWNRWKGQMPVIYNKDSE